MTDAEYVSLVQQRQRNHKRKDLLVIVRYDNHKTGTYRHRTFRRSEFRPSTMQVGESATTIAYISKHNEVLKATAWRD